MSKADRDARRRHIGASRSRAAKRRSRESIWSARSSGCPTAAAKRSCCTTSKGTIIAEVAEMLGIAEGTSKSQVFKARMKLRGLLRRRVTSWRPASRPDDGLCIRTNSSSTTTSTTRSPRPSAPRSSGTLTAATRAARSSTICARSRAWRPDARAARSARRACGRESRGRFGDNAAPGSRAPIAGTWRVARGGRSARAGDRLSDCVSVRSRGTRCARRASVLGHAAAAPAAAARGADTAQSVETELRQAEEHYDKAITGLEQIANANQSAFDPGTAATLQKNLAVIDQAISESRAAVHAQPNSRAGAAEPARELQDEDCRPAGYGGAHQRNAQRQRGGGGADRLRTQGKGRLTCDSHSRSSRRHWHAASAVGRRAGHRPPPSRARAKVK